MIKSKIAALGLSLIFSSVSWAQAPKPTKAPAKKVQSQVSSSATVPDALTAKGFLEDILIRRYQKELSTLLQSEIFNVASKIDLIEVRPAENPEQPSDALPADLMLGNIDPEELFKNYGDPSFQQKVVTVLSHYKITAVSVSVGLSSGVSAATQTDIEAWLKDRLNKEFGSIAVGSVARISTETGLPGFFSGLNKFQNLAGQFLIALAILLGGVLWKTSQGAADAARAAQQAQAQVPPQTPTENSVDNKGEQKHDQELKTKSDEELVLKEEIRVLTEKLSDAALKASDEIKDLVKTWCEAGEDGRFKLACFAESASHKGVRLPIPVDAVEGLVPVFAKMPELELSKKRDILKKTHWDILSAMNLGAETLTAPFDYLQSVETERVKTLMIEKNDKIKAIISLQMPPALRESYMSSLNPEVKRNLLVEAARLSEMPVEEFKSIDKTFKAAVGAGGGSKDRIVFESALAKLASSLSVVDEISLFAQLEGPSVVQYKATIPSLAFLGDWTEESMKALFAESLPEEVVSLLLVKPEIQDRVLAACPTMTAEVAKDEIARKPNISESDKEKALRKLKERLVGLLTRGQMQLSNIYSQVQSGAQDAGNNQAA